MSAPSSHERLGLLLGFVGMAIFGGTLPATRLAVSDIDPIALTAIRTAIAGVCSLVLLLVLRRPFPPRSLWPQFALTMVCVAFLFPVLMAMGMQRVDASHGGVVFGGMPIGTALVAVAVTHERPRPLFWIASLAGAALVVAFALRQGGGDSDHMWGLPQLGRWKWHSPNQNIQQLVDNDARLWIYSPGSGAPTDQGAMAGYGDISQGTNAQFYSHYRDVGGKNGHFDLGRGGGNDWPTWGQQLGAMSADLAANIR